MNHPDGRDRPRDPAGEASPPPVDELLRLLQQLPGDPGDPGPLGLSPADEFAAGRRSAECLSMQRLRELRTNARSTPLDPSTSPEAAHSARCSVCAGRLAAFFRHGNPVDEKPIPGSPLPPTLRSRVTEARQPRSMPISVRGWSVAAAAAVTVVGVVLFLFSQPHASTARPGLVPSEARWDLAAKDTPVESSAPGHSERLPNVEPSFLAGVWVEEFERVVNDCAVVAFVRAWDESCACLRWRQHHFVDADGEASLSQTLESGDLLEVQIEVPGATPPVEQLVLVATAPTADHLPISEAAAQKLLDCLGEPQCLDEAEAFATYVSTAPGCFADGVRLIPRSFVVE